VTTASRIMAPRREQPSEASLQSCRGMGPTPHGGARRRPARKAPTIPTMISESAMAPAIIIAVNLCNLSMRAAPVAVNPREPFPMHLTIEQRH